MDIHEDLVSSYLRFDDGDPTLDNEYIQWFNQNGVTLNNTTPLFGGGSAVLDGTKFLYTNQKNAFTPTVAFTAEMYLSIDASQNESQSVIFGTRPLTGSYGYNLYVWNGQYRILAYNGSGACVDTTIGTVVYDTTQHLALTRTDAGLWSLWIDGVLVGSTTESSLCSMTNVTEFRYGREADDSRPLSATIDECRWTLGVDRYDAPFTPPVPEFYKLSGNVSVGGVVTRRQINIHNRETGKLLKTVYSDLLTGDYEAIISTQDLCYIVIMEDPFYQRYESRVQDFAIPVPV